MPNGNHYTEYERGFHDGLKRAEEIVRTAQPAPQTRMTWDGYRTRVANLIKKALWAERHRYF